MITRAANCSVRVFMSCLFDNDYTGLQGAGIAEFENIYTEFIDLSGIGETIEFDLKKAIHNLNIRIAYVKGIVDLHRISLQAFSQPFFPAMNALKKCGHRLKWEEDNRDDFLKQLDLVVIKEKSFESELDLRKKELADVQKKEIRPDTNGRQAFIRSLNNLGRANFKIDKDQTTVEELALMIKDQNEWILAEANKKKTAFA